MDLNKDLIQKGRKKVYSATENMELLLPDGKSDGILDKDDVVYVVQEIKNNGKALFRFRVMKFFETDKESKIYYGDKNFFQPYFEVLSNSDGDSTKEKDSDDEKEENKSSNKIMIASALGVGLVGFVLARTFMRNKIYFTLGGLAVGALVGKILSSKK